MPTNAGQSGAAGAAAGGGADADDAGEGGGGEAGAAEVLWPLSGEYTIDSPALGGDAARHVRIISRSEALVSAAFGAELPYTIEETPGAALETIQLDGRPHVRGPIVIRNANEEFAISGDPAAGTAEAHVVVSAYPCPSITATWTSGVGSMRRDDDPTVVEGFIPVWIPWQPMLLRSRKLAGEPLQSSMTVRTGGMDVAVTWSAGNVAGEASAVWATLADGLGLIGKTITFAGSVQSTNGVPSPVGPADVAVLDFGPARAGVLDFVADNPPDLATFGEPLRVPAGDATCTGGCLSITTGQGIALRLTNPGATLRVDALGGQLTVDAHAPGLEPTSLTGDFFSGARDFPLPAGASEVFLTITVPYAPPMQNVCSVAQRQTSRLLSVSAGG